MSKEIKNVTLDEMVVEMLYELYKNEFKKFAKKNKELKSKIKHTEDLLNQALKELEELQ